MPPPTTPAPPPLDSSPSSCSSPARRARRARSARWRVASLVAGVWLLGGLPVLLGLASCPVARFLHTPCPGCGMTRAFDLLLHGDVPASLGMHPLAVPTALVQLAFAAVTVVVSLQHGTPFVLWRTRIGRAAVHAVAAVLMLDVVLWLLRFAGFAHGPVPV